MELENWQNELMRELCEHGLAREDILSVMLVLTKEEKGTALLTLLRAEPKLSPDEIVRAAGRIAFPCEA